MDFYNEHNLSMICGNCKNCHYLQDVDYGGMQISGWYCDEWLSFVEFGDDTCGKWGSMESDERSRRCS